MCILELFWWIFWLNVIIESSNRSTCSRTWHYNRHWLFFHLKVTRSTRFHYWAVGGHFRSNLMIRIRELGHNVRILWYFRLWTLQMFFGCFSVSLLSLHLVILLPLRINYWEVTYEFFLQCYDHFNLWNISQPCREHSH